MPILLLSLLIAGSVLAAVAVTFFVLYAADPMDVRRAVTGTTPSRTSGATRAGARIDTLTTVYSGANAFAGYDAVLSVMNFKDEGKATASMDARTDSTMGYLNLTDLWEGYSGVRISTSQVWIMSSDWCDLALLQNETIIKHDTPIPISWYGDWNAVIFHVRSDTELEVFGYSFDNDTSTLSDPYTYTHTGPLGELLITADDGYYNGHTFKIMAVGTFANGGSHLSHDDCLFIVEQALLQASPNDTIPQLQGSNQLPKLFDADPSQVYGFQDQWKWTRPYTVTPDTQNSAASTQYIWVRYGELWQMVRTGPAVVGHVRWPDPAVSPQIGQPVEVTAAITGTVANLAYKSHTPTAAPAGSLLGHTFRVTPAETGLHVYTFSYTVELVTHTVSLQFDVVAATSTSPPVLSTKAVPGHDEHQTADRPDTVTTKTHDGKVVTEHRIEQARRDLFLWLAVGFTGTALLLFVGLLVVRRRVVV